jgi:hypothetical protein
MQRLCRAALRAARAATPPPPHSAAWRRAAGGAPQRDPRFAVLHDDDVAFFRTALGSTAVITGVFFSLLLFGKHVASRCAAAADARCNAQTRRSWMRLTTTGWANTRARAAAC